MAQPYNIVGVNNTFRRKFNNEEYLQRALERREKESQSKSKRQPVRRKPLKHRVERASLEQVQQRLENRNDPGTFTEKDLDERVVKQQQEEEERKRQKREKKKEKKNEKAMDEEVEVDADVAAMMGFGGFGASKK